MVPLTTLIFRNCRITVFTDSIDTNGILLPPPHQCRLEIHQLGESLIVIEDAEFVVDFLSLIAKISPRDQKTRHHVTDLDSDVSSTQNCTINGMVFGVITRNGHLLIALNDFKSDQCVAYLSPECNAVAFFREMFMYCPVGALGVGPGKYLFPPLYDTGNERSLQEFCCNLHRNRLPGDEVDGKRDWRMLYGDVAAFVCRLLFHDLLLQGRSHAQLERARASAMLPAHRMK